MNFNVQLGGGQFGGQQQFGMMEPQYNQISVGQGINNNEYQTIVNCCKQAYMQKQQPYSNNAGRLIKQYMGGNWFIIVYKCKW